MSPCLTPGTWFHTRVGDREVSIRIDLPAGAKDLTQDLALEGRLHDAVERALAPLFAEADRPLPWATPLIGRRCRAVLEPRQPGSYYGRCELRPGHEGDHALERGFDTPRWSTAQTGI